jgi:aminomethyltransferase
MSPADEACAARRAAGIFVLTGRRGLLEVRGADRVRFLQGQLSNDVAGLAPGGPRSGCYALALTPQGRIVADAHVLAREDAIWLETDAARTTALRERLARYVIADDVSLEDRSAAFARFGIEGPRAEALVAEAAGGPVALAPEAWVPLRVAGRALVAAAFGWSGERAVQLFAAAADAAAVEAALRSAASRHGGVWGSPEALEILRIEAGVPGAGAELGEQALPAELGLLERAVSFTKGCYTGQEVVARMHSRGRVGHLLVGIALDAEGALPGPGAPIVAGAARVGELTSATCSPHVGPIGLGFVRSGHHAAGTPLVVAGRGARVAPLPFVRRAAGASPA